MTKFFRFSAGLASAAALSLVATPVLARDYWGHRHRDRVDAGDVFAGILILGGIAAVASAASKAKREREQRPEYRYPDEAGRDRDSDRSYEGRGEDNRPDWSESRGINTAINRCADEVERGSGRIESVDSVNRDGSGWRVAGRMEGGKGFSCSLDGDGRIRLVDLDGARI
jgi:hypothetical protein